MNIILEFICCLAMGVWLSFGIYLLISEIISLYYIWKTNKADNNFVRVDLPEHAGFGPFHSIWTPPYKYIRKDCLESELEQSKFYVKVLKKTIKGKKLSRDELMLLLEKGFFELESAENLPRHTCTADPFGLTLELESLIRKCRTRDSDKKVFEDEQRPHNEEIVDSVRGEPRFGREVHLNNEAHEDKPL